MGLDQLSHGLGRFLCRPNLRGHPALHAELRAHYDPRDRRLHLARLDCRLRRLAMALSWRSLDIWHRHPWHLPPTTNALASLDHRAARYRSHQYAHGPDPDPHHPGPLVHRVVLPKLLHRHPARIDKGCTHRWRGVLSHFLAHRVATLAADSDRDRDLAVHPYL